jgi:hypothetical protein
MRVPSEVFIVVIWPISMALIFGLLWVNDGIVRHICRREGKRYSIFWMFGSYWHFRSFSFNWFKEAKEAGYLSRLVVMSALWIVFMLGVIVLQSGGFVYSRPAVTGG